MAVPKTPHAQVVVSDMPGCGGWEYAAAHAIPTEVYTGSAGTGLSTEALVAALKQRHAVDFVLLAGYLKVGCCFCEAVMMAQGCL
jgi:folate-dependent phosphoribosylglycinamide formyltransferase PurN